MGEAKRRKTADPLYGRVPQAQRSKGLVISPPLTIEGTSLNLRSTDIDPQELRFALLFWDQLVWPSSRAIYIQGGRDTLFLESEGILTRPDYTYNGDGATGIKLGFFQALRDLNEKDPGNWALCQGENALLIQDSNFEADGGLSLKLCRAVPIPQKDVPLQEILEFKERRNAELLLLRHHMDSFATRILSAESVEDETHRCVREIEKACSDLVTVGREWQMPFHFSDMSASVSIDFQRILSTAKDGAKLAATLPVGIPITVGAAIGAIAGLIKVEGAPKIRSIKAPASPYRYSYLAHKELI